MVQEDKPEKPNSGKPEKPNSGKPEKEDKPEKEEYVEPIEVQSSAVLATCTSLLAIFML